MQCVEKMYTNMLVDSAVFSHKLNHYVSSQHGHQRTSGPGCMVPSVAGLLTLLDIVFDMLNDVGLCVIFSTYITVKSQETIEFEPAHGWNLCCFSRLPSRDCVYIGGNRTANFKYLKWLQCLWIVTHLKEIENCRNARDEGRGQQIPEDVCEVYRSAFLYVLEELERLYNSVRLQERVNTVCVRG